MQKIEYGDIVKQAWDIVRGHRFLWLLGFLVALGSGFSGYSFDSQDSSNVGNVAVSFFQKYVLLSIAVISLLVILAIVLYVVSIFSRAALIKAVNAVEIYAQSSFWKLLAGGKSYFWRLFALDVVFGLAIMSLVFVLVAPIIFLFYLKAYVLGSFVILGAIVILVPLLVAAHFVKKYASFYVVLAEMKFRSSIEFAYGLFSKYIKESLMMALISIGMSILISTCFFVIIMLVVAVLVLLGLLIYWFFGEIGAIITASLGGVIFLVLVAVFSGGYQAYFYALWVCFYKNIAAVEKKSKQENAEAIVSLNQQVFDPEAI